MSPKKISRKEKSKTRKDYKSININPCVIKPTYKREQIKQVESKQSIIHNPTEKRTNFSSSQLSSISDLSVNQSPNKDFFKLKYTNNNLEEVLPNQNEQKIKERDLEVQNEVKQVFTEQSPIHNEN